MSNHDHEARDNLLRARAPRRDDMLVVYQPPGIGKATWSTKHTDRHTGMIDWLDQKYLRPADTFHDRPLDTATALSPARSMDGETCAGSSKTRLRRLTYLSRQRG